MKTQEQKLREWTELVRPGKQIEIEKGVISAEQEIIEYDPLPGTPLINDVNFIRLTMINDLCGILTGEFIASSNIGTGIKLFDLDHNGLGLAGGGNILVTNGNGNVQGVVNYNSETGKIEITSRSAIPAAEGVIRFAFPVALFSLATSDGDIA